MSQDEANADDESRPISGICRSRFAGPKGEVIGQREIGQMKAWQRDLVGVGTPLTLSAATLAFAPEHAVPEWMILVASAGAIIAIAYAWWRIYVWMDRRQNYYLVSGMMLLVALIGSAAGLMFDFIWLKLLSGLVPIAIGVFVSGFARRLSRRLASAQSPRSGDGS